MNKTEKALRMAIAVLTTGKAELEAREACKAALSDAVTLPDCVVDESAPKAIWLNVGDEDSTYADALSSYEEITWCEDKQYDKDVKYIRADLVTLPDGWVSVEDSLPQYDRSVFCYCEIMGRFLGYIDEYGTWNSWNEKGILPPTHWMPLPAAPTCEKEKG